jgi:DNA-directed RNA polymerase subunit RPC12/RpoP
MTTIRGELRCFNCSRYLGDFESHPNEHGRKDVHLLRPEFGALPQQPIDGDDGLECSRCGGRVVFEQMERVAA